MTAHGFTANLCTWALIGYWISQSRSATRQNPLLWKIKPCSGLHRDRSECGFPRNSVKCMGEQGLSSISAVYPQPSHTASVSIYLHSCSLQWASHLNEWTLHMSPPSPSHQAPWDISPHFTTSGILLFLPLHSLTLPLALMLFLIVSTLSTLSVSACVWFESVPGLSD